MDFANQDDPPPIAPPHARRLSIHCNPWVSGVRIAPTAPIFFHKGGRKEPAVFFQEPRLAVDAVLLCRIKLQCSTNITHRTRMARTFHSPVLPLLHKAAPVPYLRTH